jgi:hypothetical protein
MNNLRDVSRPSLTRKLDILSFNPKKYLIKDHSTTELAEEGF